MSNPGDYTVGWICAISTERVAAEAFLDEKHEGPENVSTHDNNDYTLGKVGKHNVVIAVLPEGEYGTASAATVARDMLHSFPNIRIGLMVGIGGGAPSAKHDIRLGDVVVSTPRNGRGGVVQYDFNKTTRDQVFRQTGFFDQLPTVLRTAIAGLKAKYEADGNQLEEIINGALAKRRRLRKNYKRPEGSSDRLFQSEIVHPASEESCRAFCMNDSSYILSRHERTEDDDNPSIHYGLVASADQLMKDARLRDKLAAENDVLCFEMEAAGLMNYCPCLVIRGICDYSDSHKNTEWQGYAAMAAAAYAKELLLRIFPNRIEAEKTISSLLMKIDERIIEVDEKIETISQNLLSLNLPVVEGGAFNSYTEQHNPTCLPNTRVELLQHIFDWARDSLAKPIFWLNGMTGTGKSTVSRTIAQSLAGTGHLGASFFFKRGEGDRGKSAKLFTTIAAQLATLQPSIAAYINHAIKLHSDIGNKGLREQFNKLILQPLSKLSPKDGAPDFIALVIDALDECELEENIKIIIHLLGRVGNSRLRVFVTSRPELPIRLSFSNIQGEFQHVILHDMSVTVVEHDLSVLIAHEVRIIRDNYNRTVQEDRQLDKDWPGQSTIATMVKMAIPLFIFAATICRFLSDRKCGSPDDQLRHVLKYESRSQESKLDATYLPVLDQQVAGLSVRERGQVLQHFRDIVGSIVLLASPLSTSSLSKLLDISRDVIDARLDMLHSVLSIPPSAGSPVRLLHLSFRDFLVDTEKQGQNPFWVNETETHAKLADNCLRIMRTFLREDMYNLRSLGLEASMVSSPKSGVQIPPEIQYACLNWVFHFQESKNCDANNTEIFPFLEEHFLHWVEALSLIQRAPESIHMVRTLQSILRKQNTRHSDFLHDAARILQANLQIITTAPLQLYSSVLIFAPRNSIIKRVFMKRLPKWIYISPKVDSNWDQCIQTLEGHGFPVTSVTFSHDSSLVASASDDHTIRLWRVSTGEVQILEGHSHFVVSLAFSHDSSLLASSSCDKTIRLWRINTGEAQILKGHDNTVASVAFSHNSLLLASASYDMTIRLWHVATGKSQILKGHSDGATSVAFSSGSEFLASASYDRTVRLWYTETGHCIQVLNGHDDGVRSVAFSHDASMIASGSNDTTIKLWSIVEYSNHDMKSTSPRLAETSDYAEEIGGYDRQQVNGIAISHDSSLVASISYNGVRIWHTDTGDCIRELGGWLGPRFITPTRSRFVRVTCLVFSPDSLLVAFALESEVVWLLNINTGDCIHKFNGNEYIVSFVIFSRCCSLVASIAGNEIRLWSVDTGQCLQTFKGEKGHTYKLAFSHDSSLIAAASLFGIKLWNVYTGKRVQALTEEIQGFCTVAFTHDPSVLVGANSDNTIQLLRTDTGECVHKFYIHSSGYISFMSLTADGLHLTTNVGTFTLAEDEINFRADGYGFSKDRSWVTRNGINVLWLPAGHRPISNAVDKLTIAAGCTSGEVWIMKFLPWPQ
ncbi:Pfs, NACHT and WD domain protein [Trichoderma chlorosporum]